MTEFDDMIRKVLRGEEDDPREPQNTSVPAMILESFRGQSRATTLFAWMKMGGTFIFAFVSAIAFFQVDGVRAQIALATCFTAGFVGFGMWWIWYWMLLNRTAALREIKRLELQVAELREALPLAPWTAGQEEQPSTSP